MKAPGRLAAILLGVAAYLMAGAWHLQTSAVADLEQARSLQQREVAGEDGAPPNLDDYRTIIASLEDAIAIRRSIEIELRSIEGSVARLRSIQEGARATTGRAAMELDTLAGALGSAASSARSSQGRLTTLRRSLAVSERLARAIAEQLEELDRRLGPSAGRP